MGDLRSRFGIGACGIPHQPWVGPGEDRGFFGGLRFEDPGRCCWSCRNRPSRDGSTQESEAYGCRVAPDGQSIAISGQGGDGRELANACDRSRSEHPVVLHRARARRGLWSEQFPFCLQQHFRRGFRGGHRGGKSGDCQGQLVASGDDRAFGKACGRVDASDSDA